MERGEGKKKCAESSQKVMEMRSEFVSFLLITSSRKRQAKRGASACPNVYKEISSCPRPTESDWSALSYNSLALHYTKEMQSSYGQKIKLKQKQNTKIAKETMEDDDISFCEWCESMGLKRCHPSLGIKPLDASKINPTLLLLLLLLLKMIKPQININCFHLDEFVLFFHQNNNKRKILFYFHSRFWRLKASTIYTSTVYIHTWRTSALSYPCIMLITPFQNNKWKQHIQSSHQRDWLDPIFSHEHTQKKEEVDKMWGRERGGRFFFPFHLIYL